MNFHQDQKEWMNIRGRIQTRWDKISDVDVDKFRGNMHLIPDRVQSVYGISKERASEEYKEFKELLATEKAIADELRRFN